jgi:hypothetical protein
MESKVVELVFHMGFEKGVEVRAALLSLGDSGYFFLNAFFAGEEVFEFFFGVASGWCVWGVNVLPIGTKHFGINFILCREAAVTLNKALEFIMRKLQNSGNKEI